MEVSSVLVGLILCLLMVSAGCWVETRYRRDEIDRSLRFYEKQKLNFDALLNVLLNKKVLTREDFGN